MPTNEESNPKGERSTEAREHIDSPDCWCEPIVDVFAVGGPLIVHNESAGPGVLKEPSKIILP